MTVAEMAEATWGRHYLMCPPDHFDVSYSINPWMNTAIAVDRTTAQRQWASLVDALVGAGATVETLEPQPGLPDMVFTANAGVVDGDVFVPARMRHAERQGERAHAEAWFAGRGYRIAPLGAGVVQEGAGDALPVGGAVVAGYRTRSSATAYVQLARLVDAPIAPAQLIDPRYYHLDLTLCPLDASSAMVAPSCWDEEGRRLVAELVPDPVVLEPGEASAFCANSVVVGRTVVMPACPPRLRRQLERRGFEPTVVDVSEFLKAGGGPRCLTLALDVELSGTGGEATGRGRSAARHELPPRIGAHGDRAGARPGRAVGELAGAVELAERHGAHNYDPLPVVIARAEGSWVFDEQGRAYLDALSAYSALNFGHRHPALVSAAQRQLERVTLTSRAFHNDQLGPFCHELAALCGKERVLPMNTGAEAVETAIKTARKWGYERRGVAPDRAKIVVAAGNFHGRTTTIVSFSDDPLARGGFGPFTPGFVSVPFGDLAALSAALDEDTVAFLVEPIQGEAGVVIPPDGYLRGARELCTEAGALLIADEVQSGLGRTGRTLACDHEGVEPDLLVLGKALGGGIVPLSAVVADDDVLGVLRPGEHGSTFGGNPLACAVGREVVRLLQNGKLQDRAARLGDRLRARLGETVGPSLKEIRGRGLWLGLELADGEPPARAHCERLLDEGLLCRDTHERTIRLAPPLTVTEAELDFAVACLGRVLAAGDRLLRQSGRAPTGCPEPAALARSSSAISS